MKTRIVQIGNSRGIRIPKAILEQIGLKDAVEIKVKKNFLIIKPIDKPRSGWAAASQALAQNGEDGLLDAPTPTRFDEEAWEW